MFGRWVEPLWKKKFAAPHVHLVFGARQTGKSTLLRKLLPDAAVWLDFSRPAERAEYLRNPDLLVQRCRALPKSRRARDGGGGRGAERAGDLRRGAASLRFRPAPVAVRVVRQFRPQAARDGREPAARTQPTASSVSAAVGGTTGSRRREDASRDAVANAYARRGGRGGGFPRRTCPSGSFSANCRSWRPPRALSAADLLRSYTVVYLEEELRREALVKNWPAFARFLQLAAAESGQMINYAGISREAGVSLPTVKTYYQLLEDMFIGFRVTAFSGSPRKSLLSTERFFIFDVGVRNAAAELPLEAAAVRANPGPLFEQWVGIELWKRLQYLGGGKLHYLRSKAGAEVDFIVARGGRLIPIEVKWTEHPRPGDARHLLTFLNEHPKRAQPWLCHLPLLGPAGAHRTGYRAAVVSSMIMRVPAKAPETDAGSPLRWRDDRGDYK